MFTVGELALGDPAGREETKGAHSSGKESNHLILTQNAFQQWCGGKGTLRERQKDYQYRFVHMQSIALRYVRGASGVLPRQQCILQRDS